MHKRSAHACAQRSRQIVRIALVKRARYALASVRVDVRTRSRIPSRSVRRCAASRARAAQIAANCASSYAMHSRSPTFSSKLTPTRDACRSLARVGRVEFDRFRKLFGGFTITTHLKQHVCQVVAKARRARLRCNRACKMVARLFEFTRLREQQPENLCDVHVLRLSLREAAHRGQCLRKSPLACIFEGALNGEFGRHAKRFGGQSIGALSVRNSAIAGRLCRSSLRFGRRFRLWSKLRERDRICAPHGGSAFRAEFKDEFNIRRGLRHLELKLHDTFATAGCAFAPWCA